MTCSNRKWENIYNRFYFYLPKYRLVNTSLIYLQNEVYFKRRILWDYLAEKKEKLYQR